MRIFGFMMAGFVLLLFNSGCIKEPDFDLDIPILSGDQIQSNSNIETAIKAFEQDGSELFTFSSENDIIISAYVISNDSGGNFFKTLIVQDLPENPDYGLEIKIDLRAYHLKYNFGRKLHIKLAGLSIQKLGMKYILGYNKEGFMVNIPEGLLDRHITRSAEEEEVIPRNMKLEEIQSKFINTYVKIGQLQFVREELGHSFSSEAHDKYQGERIMEQCGINARTYLFTSTYARFKANLIPEEKFDLKAVLSFDSYAQKINFILNNPDDLSLIEGERCDPVFFSCDHVSGGHLNQTVFYEDFDHLANTRDIGANGWENINKNFGSGKFKKRSTDDNVYLQVSAYGSNEVVMESWLISPRIDMGLTQNEQLSFDIRTTFEEGVLLTVWFSEDINESIEQATWQRLDAEIPNGSRDGSNKEFFNSGPIDLNCVAGSIRLAFKYSGADPGASTTYDIDNVLILGE